MPAWHALDRSVIRILKIFVNHVSVIKVAEYMLVVIYVEDFEPTINLNFIKTKNMAFELEVKVSLGKDIPGVAKCLGVKLFLV